MARRILILGDSISTEPYTIVGQSSWPSYLRELTATQSQGLRGDVRCDTPWEITSVARTGATLQTQAAAIFPGNWDTAIVLCGRHDLDTDGVTLAVLETRALALFAALRASGVGEIVTCEMPPFGNLSLEGQRRGFNTWLRSALPTNVDRIIRIADRLTSGIRRWTLDSEFDSGDGANPSSEGGRALAGIILSALLNVEGPWYKGHNVWPTIPDFTPGPVPTTFNPTDIDDCVLWLRGDIGITLVGGKVSSWAGVGATLVQAVAGNRPTMNGKYVAFDAASVQSLRGAFVVPAGSTFDLWAVLYCTTPLLPAMIPINFFTSGVANSAILRQQGAASTMTVEAIGSGGVLTVTCPIPGTSIAVYNLKHATRQITGLSGGVARGTIDWIDNIVNAGAEVNVGDYYGGGFAWSGGIGELAMFNRALSISEHVRMLDYVRARYALTVVP